MLSGNAFPRESAWHLDKEGAWAHDILSISMPSRSSRTTRTLWVFGFEGQKDTLPKHAASGL